MASDDFNRADNVTDLGSASWDFLDSIGDTSCTINNNAARPSGTSANVWNTSFPEDQYTQMTLGVLDNGGEAWFIVRAASIGMATFTGYLLVMTQGTTTCSLKLYRGNAGSFTTLVDTVTGVAFASTDVWYLEAAGDELTVKRNGTPVSSFTAVVDGSPLTGSGYVGLGGNGSSSLTFDAWEGGALDSTPTDADETIRIVQSNLQWA